MAEFGQPYRNATQDANQGVINPPSKKYAVRQTTTPSQMKQESVLDEAFSSLGESLGGALEKHLDEGRGNIVEQKRLDAAMRQGTEKGINSVDKAKKTVGWEKFVFGQDVEYRTAQQRAAQNSVTEEYLKQATSISQYAGESPEEYRKRLSAGLDGVLKPYEGDKETQRIVSNTWLVAADKLAEKQWREHHAYTQKQHRDTYSRQVQLSFDVLTVDGSQVSTPDDAENVIMSAKEIFGRKTLPKGVSPFVAEEVILERVSENLEAGNIGAYNAARAAGWTAKLSPDNLIKLNASVKKYDAQLKLEASSLVEQANLDANEATTVLGVHAIYDQLDKSIEQLTLRKSGTLYSKDGLLQEQSEAIANEYKYVQRIKAAEEKTTKAAAKTEADAKDAEEAVTIVSQQIAGDTTTSYPDKVLTKKEQSIAMDTILSAHVRRVTGNKEMTPRDISAAIFTDNKANLAAVSSWAQHDADSTIVNQTIKTFANSDLSAYVDEKGRLNEEASNALAMIERFRTKNRTKFDKVLGANKANYNVISRGITSGQTQQRIQKDIELLRQSSANTADVQKVFDKENGRFYQTNDYVRMQLKFELGQNKEPTGQDVADLSEVFKVGLQLYNGDSEAATEYMLDDLRTGQEKVTFGNTSHFVRKVPGVGKLDHTIEDVLKYADSKKYLFKGINALVDPETQMGSTPITSLGDVKNLQVYTVAGYDGVFLNTPHSIRPIRIQASMIEDFDREITEKKRIADDINQKNIIAEAKRVREGVERRTSRMKNRHMQNYNPE